MAYALDASIQLHQSDEATAALTHCALGLGLEAVDLWW